MNAPFLTLSLTILDNEIVRKRKSHGTIFEFREINFFTSVNVAATDHLPNLICE